MPDSEEDRHDTEKMSLDEIREAIAKMDRESTLPPPALLPLLLEAQQVPEASETGEPCPVCDACECCGGTHIVSREHFATWAASVVHREIEEAEK